MIEHIVKLRPELNDQVFSEVCVFQQNPVEVLIFVEPENVTTHVSECAEKRLHQRKTTGVRIPLGGGGVDSTGIGPWNRRSQRASSGCENEFAQIANDVRAHYIVRSNGISCERGIVDSETGTGKDVRGITGLNLINSVELPSV